MEEVEIPKKVHQVDTLLCTLLLKQGGLGQGTHAGDSEE